jgi:hypothetical protein
MFFVGATGQLLTLILTVCLPFVLLVSAQPKTELLQETLNFETQITQLEITAPEISCIAFELNSADKLQDNDIEFCEIFIQKMHPHEFRVKWKSFYTESSGNKAPPAFSCYSC